MRRVRIIPVLLVKQGGLYKSIKFSNYKYVGDPINAVKIFNEKEVDEIIILDIDATSSGKSPNLKLISEIAGEAFMPLAYGGGISTIDQVKQILYEGVEKVSFNMAAWKTPQLISEVARQFGSSSVVVSIDVRKDWLGRKKVFCLNGSKNTTYCPVKFAKEMENAGAGEILLNSIDRDGTFQGFDIELIQEVSKNVTIPVIACGGASSLHDFRNAIIQGASAVAAGSYFVFQRPHRAVLITYPPQQELIEEIYSQV
ncbi:MAG: imidazole glycerol phosphate synthase subunit HisF [Sphingobacteriales bacterium 44-15]|uniref:AglZ/HisF2 family acetamidino modification protein n=1 Tax=uncultured Dysgonomonas sp. TaxID=206096 RepID=UPI000969AE22|nr:AglZ/HisF2 family acetamidino modification protein [uncultured Dysgonomonas sp.]OJY81031.1 MAG: imidazole glycerol phosphate synthase subunit HisF [Sphingobacteriales bacterium 44-15]